MWGCEASKLPCTCLASWLEPTNNHERAIWGGGDESGIGWEMADGAIVQGQPFLDTGAVGEQLILGRRGVGSWRDGKRQREGMGREEKKGTRDSSLPQHYDNVYLSHPQSGVLTPHVPFEVALMTKHRAPPRTRTYIRR